MARSLKGWLGYAGAVVVLIALSVYVFHFIRTAGFLRPLSPRGYENCEPIIGFDGPEDIVIDHDRGLAYITKADRFAATQLGEAPNGNIQLLDLKNDGLQVSSLSPRPATEFFPHGMDLWIGPDGERRLFVVNHGKTGQDHSVEIFDVTALGRLIHLKTIRSELFSDPNDIAAIGPEQFYMTNLYGTKSSIGRILESYAMIPMSNVVYYDQGKVQRSIDGLSMANGIAFQNASNTLFVAEFVGRRVKAFKHNPSGKDLEKIWELDLPIGVDNLTLDESGTLWAAGHPKLLSISARMRASQRLSPSEVIRITLKGDAKPQWETIYQDRGNGITAASVAARYEDTLYIGAVFGNRILRCSLSDAA